MNIIKLKDLQMPETASSASLFNTYLKGKYAFWIQCRYITPIKKLTDTSSLPGINETQYANCEQNPSLLLSGTYIDMQTTDVIDYIDQETTTYINKVDLFISQNEYTPDSDITLEELKKFRTWLADELLKFDLNTDGSQSHSIYDIKTTHMLEYYKNNMMDDTIKWLTDFGTPDISVYSNITKPCGCQSSSNISSLYSTTLTTCNPILIYRKNIYKLMVDTFSNIDFWIARYTQATSFILEFKKYIDNILKVGLPLVIDLNADNRFTDCGCSQNTSNQGREILVRLSEALQYIYDNEVTGHKNFIVSAFGDWSKYLYESMYWA